MLKQIQSKTIVLSSLVPSLAAQVLLLLLGFWRPYIAVAVLVTMAIYWVMCWAIFVLKSGEFSRRTVDFFRLGFVGMFPFVLLLAGCLR
jgi:hypothetical protein